jgi:hypothetical protein
LYNSTVRARKKGRKKERKKERKEERKKGRKEDTIQANLSSPALVLAR